MSHVNDAIDEGIAPVRTGTPLRQLIEDAASALDYYKSPYIDDALEQIDAVLKAGSLGSIAHDRVVRIEACRDHFEITPNGPPEDAHKRASTSCPMPSWTQPTRWPLP